MINYYQPFLLPFLHMKPYRVPEGVKRTYFLSFEDGLWVLLKNRCVPKGSVILIPDFYCMDVVNNIRAHGYSPVLYPLDDHFRITPKKLDSYIKIHTPCVTIIFHACGLTHISEATISKLFSKYKDMLVIEDSVHRLVHPELVTLVHPNHYIMDSLRKVSTLPGSFLYRKSDAPPIVSDKHFNEWRYLLAVVYKYILFRMLLVWGTIFRSPAIIRHSHERMLLSHDNIVGDSIGGYSGFFGVPHIHRYFNFAKIQKLKYAQATLYTKLIKHLVRKQPAWYSIDIPDHMKKDLHVFPVGRKGTNLRKEYQRIQKHLHKHGIISWFKFPDSPWSTKHGVLFLPLGFHITNRDVHFIMKTLEKI